MARQVPIEQRVAARIRELREARRLSQGDLAKLVNKSRSGVAQVEQGNKAPTVKTLELFARALGVSISDLVSSEPVKGNANPPAEPLPEPLRRLVAMLKSRSPEYLEFVEQTVGMLDRFEKKSSDQKD
jgi:transcriptional regulator with XRE-family HTH domain